MNRSDFLKTTGLVAVTGLLLPNLNANASVKDNKQVVSHIGMIVQSTTLDTEDKVKDIYGGTHWIQHSNYVLRGASSGASPVNTYFSIGGPVCNVLYSKFDGGNGSYYVNGLGYTYVGFVFHFYGSWTKGTSCSGKLIVRRLDK